MSETPTIMWPGLSGKEYKYWIYPMAPSLKEEPGNYIFAGESKPGYWTPCYIGQTENLDKRLGSHEKEACAKRHGATHIHAHTTSGGEAVRKAEEEDLIQKWQPPCNEQLK
jgi:predicted GIY-YIG superfamily endonuclease